MNLRRFFGLCTLAAIVFTVAVGESVSADNPTKKEIRLAQKKAAELKRAAEAKKAAEDAAKVAAAKPKPATPAGNPAFSKVAPPEPATPLKPAFIGAANDTTAVARYIDAQILKKQIEEKVTAAPLATDAEFLRRAYLDITGVIPTADQAKAFLASTETTKRAKLIDDLLASPNYGRHQSDIWMNLLIQKSSDNRRVDFSSMRPWLAGEFNANRPWNELVTEIVTASGDQEKNPAVGFYLSNTTVDKMTDDVCKVFLGLQLQCAQCHNHPFTGWQQTEYWAMAQFFMKVEVDGLGKDAKPAIVETNNVKRKKNPLPESAKTVNAKFLQAEEPKLDKTSPYRPTLAKWMTSQTNPFFAKAMVNRMWAELFGYGIVNPVDDMVGQNLPSHPDMLNALAANFAANKYDLKQLIRAICNSDAYQRSSKPSAGNEKAAEWTFARMAMKVLSPEQIYDSISSVTGGEKAEASRPMKGMMNKGQAVGPRERFVNFYLAGSEQLSTVEYEAGIPQALKLMNSRIAGNPNIAKMYAKPGTKPIDAIQQMYLATLSRMPTEAETKRLTEYLGKSSTTADGYGDILWALLNSSEFALAR